MITCLIVFPRKKMILTVCLNPTLQKTIVLNDLAEGEVNRSKEYYFDASGKGINVSRVLSQLGEKVIHLTWLGGRLKNIFLDESGKDNFILKYASSDSDIRFSYTLLNAVKHSTTEIVEEGEKIDADIEKKISRLFRKCIKKSDAVVISGTKAPGFSDDLYPGLVKIAKSFKKTIVLDFRGKDLLNSLKYRPDFIKINLQEFLQTFFNGRKPKESSIKSKLLELYEEYGITTILTDGSKNIIYNDGSMLKNYSPRRIRPVNTTGSGDAFCAGFISGFLKAGSVPEGVRLGEECGRKNAVNVRPGINPSY